MWDKTQELEGSQIILYIKERRVLNLVKIALFYMCLPIYFLVARHFSDGLKRIFKPIGSSYETIVLYSLDVIIPLCIFLAMFSHRLSQPRALMYFRAGWLTLPIVFGFLAVLYWMHLVQVDVSYPKKYLYYFIYAFREQLIFFSMVLVARNSMEFMFGSLCAIISFVLAHGYSFFAIDALVPMILIITYWYHSTATFNIWSGVFVHSIWNYFVFINRNTVLPNSVNSIMFLFILLILVYGFFATSRHNIFSVKILKCLLVTVPVKKVFVALLSIVQSPLVIIFRKTCISRRRQKKLTTLKSILSG